MSPCWPGTRGPQDLASLRQCLAGLESEEKRRGEVEVPQKHDLEPQLRQQDLAPRPGWSPPRPRPRAPPEIQTHKNKNRSSRASESGSQLSSASLVVTLLVRASLVCAGWTSHASTAGAAAPDSAHWLAGASFGTAVSSAGFLTTEQDHAPSIHLTLYFLYLVCPSH